MKLRLFLCAAGLCTAAWLTGCGERALPPVDSPRAVKLETIGLAGQSQARFVASVRQEQRASLAFEAGGRVAAIGVDVGDRVRQGQVLARLDEQPIRLRLQQAEASLRSAAAQRAERLSQLDQQQAMFADGAISQATLTSARVALDTAQAQWEVAGADRALAQRALGQAALRAPFDGSVVARLLQPAADAAAGQAVLQIEGQGRPQATAYLPQDTARTLAPGQEVPAQRAETPRPIVLRVRSVSERLDTAGSVQVLFDIARAAGPLRSGDSLLLALAGPERPLSVPLAAVLLQPAQGRGAVYLYDPQAGTVRQQAVELGPVEGERVQLAAGVKKGDRVVVAGAAFLADGQKVQPFRSESRLADGGGS
ncbi:efflux RND transporter periplasmic adaptor subunit [Paracidovorax cattleyae]|uniref:RND family efflux transporter, MFP subunit n=1 Tax=Paracidovorax cattleyae TaxID=80868 RepID=A0A1H0WLZ6_9BURK|nr:efflux RND transporter periplasmic adaptor subunit [Paracidovorax cattleyae]AVS72804.1 efflux RND transporter periplasmic adaptor subunit [Paracidovorax cattleyae]MBF9266674.1 efflux RND transporter periplasmic adaptor subunit [Paracidovorax cattleyae]SDP91643.1 RND family efflux transporter, MFP subunit [Paracidovorax cattleyae]